MASAVQTFRQLLSAGPHLNAQAKEVQHCFPDVFRVQQTNCKKHLHFSEKPGKLYQGLSKTHADLHRNFYSLFLQVRVATFSARSHRGHFFTVSVVANRLCVVLCGVVFFHSSYLVDLYPKILYNSSQSM